MSVLRCSDCLEAAGDRVEPAFGQRFLHTKVRLTLHSERLAMTPKLCNKVFMPGPGLVRLQWIQTCPID
eukprot:1158890-Pelagomonas_calceolata.AAC.2